MAGTGSVHAIARSAEARALRYLRYACDAGAKNMCAKVDALQAAAK
jgi:hypothetical protein